MSTPEDKSPGWNRALTGLGFVRRGSVMVAVSGLLLLVLGTVGRAGCANPHLPEVRSLMEYQSVVFYLALLLGFVMVVSGQLYTALMPGTWRHRRVALGCVALTTVAMVVMAVQGSPGQLVGVDAPPGGAGALAAAVLGTTAMGASALVVMQVSRALGGRRLSRSAALFGLAMITAAAANAEAACGLVFPYPVHALIVLAVVAAVDAVALFWIYHLLADSETLIREQLDASPQPAPRTS